MKTGIRFLYITSENFHKIDFTLSFQPIENEFKFFNLIIFYINFESMKREHNITMLRKELHAAVDEETRFEGKQKDVRKQLLDKVRNIYKVFVLKTLYFSLNF